jgi:hypothetical protein
VCSSDLPDPPPGSERQARPHQYRFASARVTGPDAPLRHAGLRLPGNAVVPHPTSIAGAHGELERSSCAP